MKIRIANNMGDISGEMLINPEEIGGNMGIERAASLSKPKELYFKQVEDGLLNI